MGNLMEVLPVLDDDEDEGHDCLDHLVVGMDGPRCGECGEAIDIGDATCTWCGHFPCTCDDDYERYREREWMD